ncbi:MAG: LamB/YcsF family protein, partial [Propionibacteriaceae bacterium]|nr:LamB/YcsF family protein [Propionibacteriaceae bacterium]
MPTIDLNSDIGESFGAWKLGDDAAIIEVVSSANVACGFHAGDPRGIWATLKAAVAGGVTIGAHVGYRDLAGFGRRDMDVASDDLIPEVIYQIGALRALAGSAGGKVSYVKPHGALYNFICHDERQATAVVEAIRQAGPELVLLTLPDSLAGDIAAASGIPVAREAFADRGYTPAGTLVSRRLPGAVLADPEVIAARVLRLVATGEIEAVDGSVVRLA